LPANASRDMLSGTNVKAFLRLMNVRFDTIGVLLLIGIAVGLTAWLVQSPIYWIQEDGYYYLGIAAQLAHGAGSTFDGVNLTNGYQPLWLLALVPLLGISHSPENALQLCILLQGVCVAATLVSFYRTARLMLECAFALFATFIWLAFTIGESFKGMEFAVHALGITLVAYIYLRYFTPSLPSHRRPYLALGLVASLTVLARLDTIGLAIILGVTLCMRAACIGALRLHLIAAFALPILVTVTAYAAVNLVLFSSPVPVSGLVKEAWAQQLLQEDPMLQLYGWIGARVMNLFWTFEDLPNAFPLYMTVGTFGAAAVSLIGALAPAHSIRGITLRRTLHPLAPFIAYSLLNFLFYAITLYRNLSWAPWYYVIQPWLTALFAGFGLNLLWKWGAARWDMHFRLSTRVGVTIFLTALILSPLIAPITYISFIESAEQSGYRYNPLYEGAMWARAHLPPDAVIGAWNAGTIGFLSERRTVNLDGVVNSIDFFERGRGDLCRYWRVQGITYLVDVFEGDQALSVVSPYPAYAQCTGQLQPVWSDARNFVSWRLQVYRVNLQ